MPYIHMPRTHTCAKHSHKHIHVPRTRDSIITMSTTLLPVRVLICRSCAERCGRSVVLPAICDCVCTKKNKIIKNVCCEAAWCECMGQCVMLWVQQLHLFASSGIDEVAHGNTTWAPSCHNQNGAIRIVKIFCAKSVQGWWGKCVCASWARRMQMK